MAGQAGNPEYHPISPHVISGAFVQQYYRILHEQPDQVHKFYQDSSILGRPESDGTMVSVTTLGDINKRIMSMDFRKCLTEIETADAQLSHKDAVFIVVTGSLTSDEGVCRRFTQSFFLAPQESGGYFVLNDVFRFISERQPAQINQVVTQENESNLNVRSASQTCSALTEPTPADKSLISDHVRVENNVTERQVINPSINGTAVEEGVNVEPPVQVAKEDPKKAPVVAPTPPIPTQTDVTKKSYASIVKVMKEGPLTPLVAKTTPSVAKHKPAPKPVTKAVEGSEKSSAKPTQANETTPSDVTVAENDSSRNERGYSVFLKNLPFYSNIQIVEEEFKKFGAIKSGGVQVRHNKIDRFCFGFVEFESQQSMQEAIKASPVHMGERDVYVEEKRTPTRVVNGAGIPRGDNGEGGHFQSGRGSYGGDNFRGREGGYVNNVNYRGGENFNRRNDGENFNRRNDGENFYRRKDHENFNRRNDGENFNRRKDHENFNRRNDGENFNRRSDSANFNRRNDRENFNRRNDGANFNRRNDGANFNRRNDFRNRNEFSGRGQGPPPGNGYHHNGNGFHPPRPFQNGNGKLPVAG
ncbi:nuclear transport factor 2-like isoform X2 [Phragmites australis]|nr:nuclear transport factor 2-like isoform X2 [Phragmites australis]XP_062211550.1 nuclear transport factor 2-like isoform X2 [Phragmites australis]XP_062211551.1 nuclear transport factor 2-like isoform X2 [Phragmites australis]XP_062211552.1 nuclear transport factor 2-like isoform X2 [Phragmites australis]